METKILKLKNGEEIVGNVSIVDGEYLKVQNPLKVNIYPRIKKGKVEEALAFSRWINYSDNQTYDIVKNNVIAITDSSVGLTRFYDFCVGKMEDMKTTEYRQPTDKELQGIENEVRDIMSSWYDEDDEKPTLH
tara:strand:- start:496 stop:894 length:399 start_codon:yes stop_codon:yes gene_type:complete